MLQRIFWATALTACFSSSLVALPVDNDTLANQFSQFKMAQQLSDEGKIDDAITVYQSLIKTNPLLPEAYNNLAAIYLKQNKPELAKQILEQGLHAHKGYGVLYESLTTINVAMARQAYSKALQIEGKPTDISIATLSLEENKLKEKPQPIVIAKEQVAVEETAENRIEKKVTEAPQQTQQEASAKTVDEKDVVAAITSGAIKRDTVDPVISATVEPAPASPETVLNAWSAAWSAQAVDVYLSFYHKQYKPENGLSRKNWETSRRIRLKKPEWIKVSLSDVKVTKSNSTQAVVSFKQLYNSNSFRDVSNKQMVLIYTDEGWRIYRESSL